MKTWVDIVNEANEVGNKVKKLISFINSSDEAFRYDSMNGNISFFDGKRETTFMFPVTASGKQIKKDRDLRIKWWNVGGNGVTDTDYIEDIKDIKDIFKVALVRLNKLKPAVVQANAYNHWKESIGYFTKDGSEPKHIFIG